MERGVGGCDRSALRATKRGQRRWYSGKKKRHTLKAQLLVHPLTRQILSIATSCGSTHDLRLFREAAVRLHPETLLVGDAGYQGLWREHTCSRTPYKASQKRPLTPEQRQVNRELAQLRQPIEHVIRRLKVFRLLKETYRHRRRRFRLRLNLIAALYNADLRHPT